MQNTELEAMRAERIRAAQARGVALGVNWRYLPEVAELFPDLSAEAERLQARQLRAAMLGVDWRYLPETEG